MLSIKSRLIFLYSVSSFLLLAAITYFLYVGSINVLYQADYRFLNDELERLQYLFSAKKPSTQTIKKEIVAAPQEVGSMYHYYIRLLNYKNEIIQETPGMDALIPSLKKENIDTKIIKHYFWYQVNETNYLVIQGPIRFPNKKSGLIQIALDVTYQHQIIHDQKNFLIVLTVGAFAAFLIGMIIANRGMKSLYRLTERVEQITSSSLNERIDPKTWPSELVPLGKAFNRMLDRFEDSFSRLKQVASDLAHELRTPINNLIGETEVVLTYGESKEDYQEVLASNLEEMHRLNQLIENILYLAKTENPKLTVTKNMINVYNETLILIDYFQAVADDQNIRLSCIGDKDVFLYANPVMYRRMINNLLSNAFNHTPRNGQITCIIKKFKNCASITVEDNGIGISKDHHKKIFDRFYRVDASRTQEKNNAGLGLAIVKSIVDLHHGSIEVNSETGKGTAIILNFKYASSLKNEVVAAHLLNTKTSSGTCAAHSAG